MTTDRSGQLQSSPRWAECRTWFGRAAGIVGGLLIAVMAGWVALRYDLKGVAAGAAAASVAVALYKRAYGVILGVALLVDLNGIPGVNVNPQGIAISRLQDYSGVALLVALFVVVASGKVAKRSSLQRLLYGASLSLAAWWILTWARTAAFSGVPPVLAARFARDFLYFALTLPLLCDLFVTYPRLRRQVLVTLGGGGLVFALASIAQSRGHVNLDFLLHPELRTVVQGTIRVYSPMNGLVRAAFAVSCGALILAPTQRLRRWAFVPALVFGTATLLQLTRAAYFGAAAGFLVAGSIWWFRRGPIRSAARKQLILVPLLVVFLLGLGATVSARERHLFSTTVTRAFAGYSDVSNTSGTVAVRVKVSKRMLNLLGQDWPIGLGFIHPTVHYYPSLPKGSIRNGDVGVLNALMLLGVIGAILIYLPFLLVLRGLIRAPRLLDSGGHGDEWLRLGASIWIVGVIASSITLIDLFSFGGLELSACLLALAASTAVRSTPHSQPVDVPAEVST